jgi:hypothetical protein
MADPKMPDWSKIYPKWNTDLKRFFASPHCRDLLIIAVVAVVILVVTIAIALIIALGSRGLPGIDSTVLTIVVGAVLGVCAWAFQSTNLRFGAADIFASEIVTLCRITAVIGLIPRLVEASKPGGQRVHGGQSTQDYVVIFHNNSKDLEILDGEVVTLVTEFYVHFKAMLDTMSRLPDLGKDKEPTSEHANRYREALLNVIYMAFLTFESGRNSLMRLIDDKLVRQEALLTALLNEIPAYIHLFEVFRTKPHDIRKQRIFARLTHYQTLIGNVRALAAADETTHKIADLANEVINRWNQGGHALSDSADAA